VLKVPKTLSMSRTDMTTDEGLRISQRVSLKSLSGWYVPWTVSATSTDLPRGHCENPGGGLLTLSSQDGERLALPYDTPCVRW